FFFILIVLPPTSTLFPYTTLFRSYGSIFSCSVPGRNPRRSPASTAGRVRTIRLIFFSTSARTAMLTARYVLPVPAGPMPGNVLEDRKSTRLNSSHVKISYADFCLKKKTNADHSPPACAHNRRRLCHAMPEPSPERRVVRH